MNKNCETLLRNIKKNELSKWRGCISGLDKTHHRKYYITAG